MALHWLSRLYTLSLFVAGILNCRVQIVEIVHGSALTIYTLSLFVTGVLKYRVQIVEIIHGSAVTIQALQSDVILHVPDGVYGIILGNIHTDHWRFRHLVQENDCIIAPICEYIFKASDKSERNATFRLQVPHIVKKIEDISQNVEVKFQRRKNGPLLRAQPFRENRIPTSDDILYKLHKSQLEIFSCHFSKIIITAKGIKCCCHSAGLLVFSRMVLRPNPRADVSLYFTSLHYEVKDYLQVRVLIQ